MMRWWNTFNRDHWHRHRHHHHKHHVLAFLTINNVSILLKPNEETFLVTDITLGHGLALSITFLDTNGNVMLTTPTPDSPPSWTNTTPATETLVVAPDGLTAQATSVAVGTDAISLTAIVGGATFTASLLVNVAAPPQVLGSIAINAVAT